jgi:hypothetical protein
VLLEVVILFNFVKFCLILLNFVKFCLTLFTLFRWPSTASLKRPFSFEQARRASMGKRKASQASGAASKKGNGLASRSRDDEPDPGQPTLTAYEQARLDNAARNQQLLGDMRMPQIRGEESAQPRAARTPRCEPPRRARLHPVVTQLCRRIKELSIRL